MYAVTTPNPLPYAIQHLGVNEIPFRKKPHFVDIGERFALQAHTHWRNLAGFYVAQANRKLRKMQKKVGGEGPLWSPTSIEMCSTMGIYGTARVVDVLSSWQSKWFDSPWVMVFDDVKFCDSIAFRGHVEAFPLTRGIEEELRKRGAL